MRKMNNLRWKLLSYTGTVLMVCFLFVISSVTVFAAEGKVKASAAKIRKEASTSSEAIGSAVKGQTFTITDEVTGADNKVWYQITFDGSKTGYIRSDLMDKSGEIVNNNATVNPTVEVEDVQPISAKITGGTVRVRSDATTEGSSIIANVVKDSVVTITGRAKDTQNKTWYLVSFSSDTGEVTGFIREDFLSPSGEVKPLEKLPEVTPPAETAPPAEESQTPSLPIITDRYQVVEKDGVWYLLDREEGYQYETESLIKTAKDNMKIAEELRVTTSKQRGIIVVLVILLLAAIGIAILFFLKMKDAKDEAYIRAVEKETMRQRQGQKANNPGGSTGVKKVTNTTGKDGNRPNSGNRPAGQRPAGQRPAGTTPQTVKVSDPAETRASRPAGQQRPAGAGQPRPAGQRPAGQQTSGTVAKPAPQRPVGTNGQERPVSQQPKPATADNAQTKVAENANKQTWQSKNFVNDDDDEFEFEFLNWDGDDTN